MPRQLTKTKTKTRTSKVGARRNLDSEALANFRTNLSIAMEYQGLSLRASAKLAGLNPSHLSRMRKQEYVRPGSYAQPIIPGLDMADHLSRRLGFELADMISAPSRFIQILQQKRPGFRPGGSQLSK